MDIKFVGITRKLSVLFLCAIVLVGCTSAPSGVQVTLTAIYYDRLTAEPTSVSGTSITPDSNETASPLLTEAREMIETPQETLQQTPSPTPEASFVEAAEDIAAPAVFTVVPKATPEPRKPGKYWAEWPLIPPALSDKMWEVYRLGLQNGNDPHAFSTIGDCQSAPAIFMGTYDTDHYVLGEGFSYLDETINQFKGSFGRQSITVKDGQSVASVLSPAWADPKQCDPGETPLDCELRIHKPSIIFINLGTNWQGGDEVKHSEYLRKIVEICISHGVVPILSSKGDNQEGDHRINRATAQIAYDYDLPFWNFWRSIRDLPGKGIDSSKPGGYLITEAWGRRSFTGLQALDAVWKGLTQ